MLEHSKREPHRALRPLETDDTQTSDTVDGEAMSKEPVLHTDRLQRALAILERGGRVEITSSPAKIIGPVAILIVFTALFAVFLWFLVAEHGVAVLSHPGFWLGLVSLLLCGGAATLGAVGLYRPTRLLTNDGFGLERRRGGNWRRLNSTRWAEVASIGEIRIGATWLHRGTRMICYKLTPQAIAAQALPRWRRLVRRADWMILGRGGAAVANIYRIGQRDLLELVTDAHRRGQAIEARNSPYCRPPNEADPPQPW